MQLCHLLWALVADPRVSYSPLRTDPLDRRVAAAEVGEPSLVWLLQQATWLPHPARAEVYQQVDAPSWLSLPYQHRSDSCPCMCQLRHCCW